MTFSQLTPGSTLHILESIGTFKKSIAYNTGTVVSVSKPYDEPLPTNQQPFQLTPPIRRKLVDVVLTCCGEQKTLSVAEEKTVTSDPSIGLTVAIDKQSIIDMVKKNYDENKAKRDAIVKYEEEMNKCQDILDMLEDKKQVDVPQEVIAAEASKISELESEMSELKAAMAEFKELKAKFGI